MDKFLERLIFFPICAVGYIFVTLLQEALHISIGTMGLVCFGVCILSCCTLLPYEIHKSNVRRQTINGNTNIRK